MGCCASREDREKFYNTIEEKIFRSTVCLNKPERRIPID